MIYVEQLMWVVPIILLSIIIPSARGGVKWGRIADVAAACICGYAVLYATNAYVVDHYIDGGTLVASDYTRYCDCVGVVRDGVFDRYVRIHSILPALLPGVLSTHFGVLDGLLYTSMFATFLAIIGLYAWGYALGGRLSGILSALFFAAIAPLSVIVRQPTFYPEITAVFIWTMASTALAVRHATPASFFLSGCSIALSLLIDLRGLLWAAPVLIINLSVYVYELVRPRWCGVRYRMLMIFAFVIPIFLSFPAGRLVYLPGTTPLERQVAISIEDQARWLGIEHYGGRAYTAQFRHGGYVWGWSSPRSWVGAVLSVKKQRDDLVDSLRNIPAEEVTKVGTVWSRHVSPFLGILSASLIVIFIYGFRDKRSLLAVVASMSIPLLMIVESAQFLVMVRYIQSPIAVVPVIIGVAIARFVSGGVVLEPDLLGPALWKAWLRPAFVVVSCVLLVTGAVDSYVSPRAAWRVPLVADTTIRHILNIARYDGVTHNRHDAACRSNIIYDMTTLNIPDGSRIYRPW